MTHRAAVALAGLGRMGQVHAANLAARCVRDGLPPRVTGYDALAAFDLARAADQSWRSGRAVTVEPRRTGHEVIYRVAPDSN